MPIQIVWPSTHDERAVIRRKLAKLSTRRVHPSPSRFLMVFLIQNSQHRDGAAIEAKLDVLIRTSAARNRYIGI